MKVTKKVKTKLAFSMAVMTLALFGLGGRVYYIKTVHGEEYETEAKIQVVRSHDMTIAPNRGTIMDRNKQALAISTTVYNVVLDPKVLVEGYDLEEQERTIRTLSETPELELKYEDLKKFITIDPSTGKLYADTNWKILKKQVSREVVEKLKEENLRCVYYQKDTKRSYPLNTVACHVLGFMRDTNWGLENSYNEELSGTPGRSFISYDGSSNASAQEIPAEDGATIITTIDYTIQQYAEQAVQKAFEDYNPQDAAILVMNPKTGEVLAMASAHKFDNNNPSEPLELQTDPSFQAKWDAMTPEEKNLYWNTQWRNFNITNSYEPGSIFKPMVVAAALEEGIVSENDPFFCSGVKNVAGESIHCWRRTYGHGQETLQDLLTNSCNVGMMDIGERMGKELFYKYQKDFGFGELTGIDLPGEASASFLMYSVDRMGPVELATMSFGQSFNCTSIQVLNAFSAVINGGDLMKPYVVSQVVKPDGTVIKENRPEVIRKVISKETSDTVRRYMRAVVEDGTGSKAKIEGYSIGGKTGTAQQGNRDEGLYTLSFIGYIPVENPEIVALVVIDKPEEYVEGSSSCAPTFKLLMENIIKYKNIEPEFVTEQTEVKKTGKVVVDDYTDCSLREVTGSLESLKLNYEVIGSGNKVTNQAPHGGTEVEEGSKILLYVTKAEGDTGNIQVPNVSGLSYDEAVGAITDARLEAVIEGDQAGVVLKQSPSAGISVEEGTEITLTFGVKEEEENPS